MGRMAIYGGAALGVSVLVWTVLRPWLVITDGVPTATDPLDPLGVLLVNLVAVSVLWAGIGVVDLAWWMGRSSGRPEGAGVDDRRGSK